MPDGRLAQSFLSTANTLIPRGSRRPSQARLRRAISTAYYAVFHCLAKTAADSLVGATKSKRPNKAWVEIYRGLAHGPCKQACKNAGKVNFPDAIHDFADSFVQLQEARHDADYDPMFRTSKEQAQLFVAIAEKSIETLRGVSLNDKKAFVTWVLITSPGALQARKKVQNNREQ